MTTKTVLLLRNHNELATNLITALIQGGYRLQVVASIEELQARFSEASPDFLIAELDLATADCPWCAALRKITEIPILLLGHADQPEAVVRALAHGADLYLPHGIRPDIVVAYVATILRRIDKVTSSETVAASNYERGYYQDDQLTIDTVRRVVLVAGNPVSLTLTEFELLVCLLEHAGRAVSYEQLLSVVWGWELSDHSHIHTHISHLRQKLGDDAKDPAYILTEYGIGYRFRPRR